MVIELIEFELGRLFRNILPTVIENSPSIISRYQYTAVNRFDTVSQTTMLIKYFYVTAEIKYRLVTDLWFL